MLQAVALAPSLCHPTMSPSVSAVSPLQVGTEGAELGAGRPIKPFLGQLSTCCRMILCPGPLLLCSQELRCCPDTASSNPGLLVLASSLTPCRAEAGLHNSHYNRRSLAQSPSRNRQAVQG